MTRNRFKMYTKILMTFGKRGMKKKTEEETHKNKQKQRKTNVLTDQNCENYTALNLPK